MELPTDLDLDVVPTVQASSATEFPSLWSNTEEEDCCRVCHGEAEESRPLFHPCKCSGSIKFVHQDCLQTWLKFSNQKHPKCELCAELFNFRNIYATGLEGKPPKLSIFEFTYDLYKMTAQSAVVIVRVAAAVTAWLIGFPYCTYWWMTFTDCFAYRDDSKHLFTLDILPKNFLQFLTYWWIGFENTILIILIYGVLMKISDMLNFEILKLRHVLRMANLNASLKTLRDRLAKLEQQREVLESDKRLADAETGLIESTDALVEAEVENDGLGSGDYTARADVPAADFLDLSVVESNRETSVEVDPYNSANDLFVADKSIEADCEKCDGDDFGVFLQNNMCNVDEEESREFLDSPSNVTIREGAMPASEDLTAQIEEVSSTEDPLLPDADSVHLPSMVRDLGDDHPHIAEEDQDILNHADIGAVDIVLPPPAVEVDPVLIINPILEDPGPLDVPRIRFWGIRDFFLRILDNFFRDLLVPGADPPVVVVAAIPDEVNLLAPIAEHLWVFLCLSSAMIAYLAVFRVLPALLARAVLCAVDGTEYFFKVALDALSIIDAQSLHLHRPFTAESAKWWSRVLFTLERFIGTCCLASVCTVAGAALFFNSLEKGTPVVEVCVTFLKEHLTEAISKVYLFFKVFGMVSTEVLWLPQLLGIAADVLSLRAFNLTLKDRWQMCSRMSGVVPCFLVHWMAGFVLYCHLQVLLDVLENVIQRRLFLGVLPRITVLIRADQGVFRYMEATTVSAHIKQLLTDVCFIIPALMLTVFIPVRCGHYFFPFASAVVFKIDDSQVEYAPLETILFHILVPIIIEKVHYWSLLWTVVGVFFKHACTALDLTEILIDKFVEDGMRVAPWPPPLADEARNVPNEAERHPVGAMLPNQPPPADPLLLDTGLDAALIEATNSAKALLNDLVVLAAALQCNTLAEESSMTRPGGLTEEEEIRRRDEEELRRDFELAVQEERERDMDSKESVLESIIADTIPEGGGPGVAMTAVLPAQSMQEMLSDSPTADVTSLPEDTNQSLDERISDGLVAVGILLDKSKLVIGSDCYTTEIEALARLTEAHHAHQASMARYVEMKKAALDGQWLLDDLHAGRGSSITDRARMHLNSPDRHSSTVPVKLSWRQEAEKRIKSIPMAVKSLPHSVRCFLFLVLLMLFYSAVMSWSLHLPLEVGRGTLKLLRFRSNNDVYSYPVGLAACWAVNYIVQFIRKDVVNNSDYRAIASVAVKWTVIVAKITVLGSIWLTVPPFLIGLLVEMVSTMDRTPYNETLKLPLVQCWTLGLLYLKIWVRMSLVFEGSEWCRKFQRVINNGVQNVEVGFISCSIILPIICWLLEVLLVPYFLARCACYLTASYTLQTALVRYSFAFYLAFKVALFLGHTGYKSLVILHDQIRDSRYLLGKELKNR